MKDSSYGYAIQISSNYFKLPIAPLFSIFNGGLLEQLPTYRRLLTLI